MNSKRLGNIGEAHALTVFVDNGIAIYQQFGDNEPADYIVIYDSVPIKIQVKTSSWGDKDVIKFILMSSSSHRRNGGKHIYTTDEVDAFVCYDITRNVMFLVENNMQKTISLRYNPTINNQSKSVRMADDYIFSIDKLKCIAKDVNVHLDKNKTQQLPLLGFFCATR